MTNKKQKKSNLADGDHRQDLVKIALIPISQIIQPKDWQPADSFDALTSSIDELGLLNPISVTRIASNITNYEIIAGRDRFNVALKLGWKEIPAIIQEFDPVQCETAEIDENLFRKTLSALRTAVQLLKRKNLHKEANEGEVTSPISDFAQQMGLSPRSIQQYIFIAENLAPEVIETLWGTVFENRKEDLLLIARMDQAKQKACAEKIKTAHLDTLAEVLQALVLLSPLETSYAKTEDESKKSESTTPNKNCETHTPYVFPDIHYLAEKVITCEEHQNSFLTEFGKQQSFKKFCVFEIGFINEPNLDLIAEITKKIVKAIEQANKKMAEGAVKEGTK